MRRVLSCWVATPRCLSVGTARRCGQLVPLPASAISTRTDARTAGPFGGGLGAGFLLRGCLGLAHPDDRFYDNLSTSGGGVASADLRSRESVLRRAHKALGLDRAGDQSRSSGLTPQSCADCCPGCCARSRSTSGRRESAPGVSFDSAASASHQERRSGASVSRGVVPRYRPPCEGGRSATGFGSRPSPHENSDAPGVPPCPLR